MSTLFQKLTLVSHLVKAHVERADKDKDNMVTIEEILAFDDFEFLETVYPAVSELGSPGIRLGYLVCSIRLIIITKTLSKSKLFDGIESVSYC